MASNLQDNDPNKGLGIIDTAEQIIRKVVDLSTYFKDNVERGHIALVLIVSVALALGGLSWNLIRPTEPPKDIGVIQKAIISRTYSRQVPGQSGQPNLIEIKFLKSNCHSIDDGSGPCAAKVAGTDGSCGSSETCQAVMENVDEGLKKNSSNIQIKLNDYISAGQCVDIVFPASETFPKVIWRTP